MSRQEMQPVIEKTGATFTDVATQQTELFEGRETDIMGCFRSLAKEIGAADQPMMVSMLKTAPRHLELQMPGTIRWMQKIQPHLVMFCPFMNPEVGWAWMGSMLGMLRDAETMQAIPDCGKKCLIFEKLQNR